MTTTVEPDHVAGQALGVYVYGIVEAVDARVPTDLTGLDGRHVELVEQEGVAAAVGPLELDRAPRRREDLLAHSAVLEALAATGPVVPVQFGSVVTDPDTVRAELLSPELDQWRALLDALRDRSQFNLRATYHEEVLLGEVVSENPEIAALCDRTRDLPEDASFADRVRQGELVSRAVDAKRARDAELLLGLVLPHAVSYSPRDRGGVDHLLDVALLVDDARRNAFEEAMESVAEGMHERVRFQLRGPLPPYDFVDGDWWV